MSQPPISHLGRYDIVALLATGGMAEIMLGRLVGPSGFERPVVVKRILPHLARVPAFVDMFVDEARIVAGIRHPNVVTVQELAHDGDELFLVMEYLEGESLGGLLRRLASRQDRLDHALAAFIVAEACAGLHAAHELKDDEGLPRDLVHRDISPQNVFVTYAGQVKVLDFGIAKAANRSTRTEAGQVKGKFAYMSPEQCLGKHLDRRSDIFALGIVLWELSTGHRLFRRKSEHLTFKAICEDPIRRPSEVAPDYPAALEKVCMRALARRREDRYQTALEMRRDLMSAARGLGLSELAEEDLRQLMHRLFDERIESKQDMLRRAGAGSMPTSIPAAEADEDVELPASAAEANTMQTFSDASPTPAAWSGRWIAPAVLAVVVVGGAAFALRRNPPAPTRRAPAPTPTPVGSAAPVVPTPSASSAVAATVSVRIETTPSHARVLLDGQDRGHTPVDLELPRGGKPLELELTRPGFAMRKEKLVPNVSQRLVLPLTPVYRAKPAHHEEIPRFR